MTSPPNIPPSGGPAVAVESAVFEQMDEGVAFFDRESRYRYVNAGYERLVGRGRHELLGRRPREVDAGVDEAFAQVLQRVAAGGVAEAHERFDAARGAHLYHRVFPLPGGACLVTRDVTAQRRFEREAEALITRERVGREQAEGAGRARDEFLGTVSHELRTPLNAILGWASLLRAGEVDEGQRDMALATIERNARAQARLIDDLLDIARILRGEFALDVGTVDVGQIIAAAVEAVLPAAELKSIRLEPELDVRAMIAGDALRLQQVFRNLLSNAIKYTPRGGQVRVLLRREAAHVEAVVADKGQGIEPELLPHVFDQFRRADGAAVRRFGGLGLGLPIVRSIIELHGGTVKAASDGPRKGATFTVRLPTASAQAANEAPPRPSQELLAAAPFERSVSLAGRNILVIDDDADARSFIVHALRQCGATVTQAAGTGEAIVVLERGRFDVLISDVGMPGEDGYALLRKVRALPPDRGGLTPALALTAHARVEDRTAALKAGFSMYMSKPVNLQELLGVVDHLARRGG
ncbi:MAG: ATP-binding protein [Polyangiaceae bacterium]|jgi:PAS domain S-box-containing protein|nr:ATP-binding protein [Polyangiaceae bacterium]